jgi:energy-coupling factor transport system ATP-binding protein
VQFREIPFSEDVIPLTPPPFADTAPTVLAVENLFFSINGKSILQDIGFTLHRGECLAVLGANGAGKTVLLKHLNGLHRPDQGRIRVMDIDTRNTRVSELARWIGIAFQNPNDQFFKLTVRDEIVVSAKALNCYDPDWITELIRLFHLEPLMDRAPFRLSGGEKKRVAFAAALAAKPAILALDEPTAGQGWYFRKALGRLLTKLQEMGQSLILVTHDLSFAEVHAHRWLVLAEGQVIAEGRPWDVMRDSHAMERAHLEPTDAYRLWGKKLQAEG